MPLFDHIILTIHIFGIYINICTFLHFTYLQMSPYPSDKKLQEDLVTTLNWQAYKKAVVRQFKAKYSAAYAAKV